MCSLPVFGFAIAAQTIRVHCDSSPRGFTRHDARLLRRTLPAESWLERDSLAAV
jgi:hypothetical protein